MTNLTASVQFFNRYTQTIEQEAIYGEAYLKWAYETRLGALSRWAFIKRPLFSHWYGWRMNQFNSAKRITPFIEKYHLNPDEWEKKPDEYKSFNDFFTRKLKSHARPIDNTPNTIVFPADGRHMAFQNVNDITHVFVKGQKFNLEALIGKKSLAKKYQNGSLLLSRLCPVDYHRFHFPCEGTPSEPKLIKGNLLSVNPIALRKHLSIFWENKRFITLIQTPQLGQIIYIEIGATCVGSVSQTYIPHTSIKKGDEKGYFNFGGSSTILLFEPEKIQFSKDLLQSSSQQLELYAKMGDIAGYFL